MKGARVLSQTAGEVRVFAPGKVNLYLEVGATDPADPRHRLLSVFQELALGDTLTLCAGGADRVVTALAPGLDAPADLDTPSNLAWRAVEALREAGFEVPGTQIHIAKHIPVAGGMAGGSADAAGALVGARALYELDATDAQLLEIARKVGSDVPFCVLGGTAIGTEYGDVLRSVPGGTKMFWALIVAKNGLRTPQVFQTFDALNPQPSPLASTPPAEFLAALHATPSELAKYLRNDLQAPALRLRPELAEVIATAEASGALRAMISGSGPTVAALCDSAETASRVAAATAALDQVATTIVSTS